MLPYGAPTALILFLPLVEIFSQIIRPLTLTIRFATNISAAKPYTGMAPHGAVLDTIEKNVTVNGHTGKVIIKRNYGVKGYQSLRSLKILNRGLKHSQ
jgi:hypothetical protein